MTPKQVKQWATAKLAEIEPQIGAAPAPEHAALVAEAKALMYAIGLHDFALSLPDDAERKSALTAANQLRRIIKELDTPAPPTDGAAMSVVQATALLGVSKETVYKLCAEGDLSHNRVGARITITGEQLADFRQRRER